MPGTVHYAIFELAFIKWSPQMRAGGGNGMNAVSIFKHYRWNASGIHTGQLPGYQVLFVHHCDEILGAALPGNMVNAYAIGIGELTAEVGGVQRDGISCGRERNGCMALASKTQNSRDDIQTCYTDIEQGVEHPGALLRPVRIDPLRRTCNSRGSCSGKSQP